MADRGRRLDDWTRRRIERLAESLSIRKTAREANVVPNTVRKVLREKKT